MDSRSTLHMSAPSPPPDTITRPCDDGCKPGLSKNCRVVWLDTCHTLFSLCMPPLYHIHPKCQIHVESHVNHRQKARGRWGKTSRATGRTSRLDYGRRLTLPHLNGKGHSHKYSLTGDSYVTLCNEGQAPLLGDR